jgi:hypothetical protein
MGQLLVSHRDIQGYTNPSEIAKAACPPAECEDAQPEEDPALNPMRQATEDLVALLPMLVSISLGVLSRSDTHKEPAIGDDARA